MADAASEKSIFLHAAGIEQPAARAAYLDEACQHDPLIRNRVEELLAAHDCLGAEPPPTAGPEPTMAQLQGPDAATVIGGRFKLLEVIGEGGMGTVWLAEQTEPVRRKVALKLIKRGMDSKQVLARFEAERQALALMDHPNIARVLDGGVTGDGRPYFVMELVKGTPITRYCDEHHLTPKERLDLFVPICQAVQHAHQKGIIHRDLKPSNVLVAPYDARPVVKVIDFGVAKAAGQQLTEKTLFTGLGAVVGTLEYMSPEQAELNNQDIDTRSDIYSLGVMLYELLTGTTPLTSKRLKQAAFVEALRVIREEEPPKPSTRLSDSKDSLPSISAQRRTEPAKLTRLVRGELDWIVMKALEKDRNRRYETANAFAADVQRYLSDETVQACPPSVGYRLRKFVRRNWGPVVAAALVLAVLLVGIAGTSLGLIRAERARGDAFLAKDAEAEQRQAAEKSDQETRKANASLRDTRDELQNNLYAARSNLIQSAWDAPGVARMRELLEEQKPRPGERDLRGFEWHYWNRRANAELTVGQPASPDEKSRVNWRYLSPNGRRQAILWGGRNKIEVRDTLSGMTVTSFEPSIPVTGRQGTITYPWLTFTSDSEGLFVLWVPKAKDRAAAVFHWSLFDVATGKELVGLREAQCEEIGPWFLGVNRSLLATPVVVASPAKGVRLKLWSVATGKEARACDGTFATIQQTAFRPDGKEIAAVVSTTAPDLQLVKVWDTATGRERLSLPAGSGLVSNLSWSPDGRRLAVPATTLRIWDAVEGRELLAVKEPIAAPPAMVTFSPDGGRLACVEPGTRFVSIKDTATGQIRTTLKTTENAQIVGAAFVADGGQFLTLSRFGVVRTWDATASELPIELPEPDASLHGAWDITRITGVDANATRIARADGAKDQDTASLQVWDASGRRLFATKRPCRSDKRDFVTSVYDIALSPDGRRVAWVYGLDWGANTEPEEGIGVRLTVIDLQTGKDLWSRDLYSTGQLQFSPDGHWLAAGQVRSLADGKKIGSSTFRVLHVETGREVYSFPGGAFLMNFSGDGTRLVGLSDLTAGPSLNVWDLKDGSPIMSHSCPELVTTPGVGQLAVSRDGTRLAISWRESDTAGIVRLYEVPSGDELRVLKGLDGYSTMTFSPDGRRLAAAADEVVKIWDTATGHDLITFRDPIGGLGKLGFSPDGHRLHAVARYESKWLLKTWDATPRSQAPSAPLDGR